MREDVLVNQSMKGTMQLSLPKLVKEPIPEGFWTRGHAHTVSLPLLQLSYFLVCCLVTMGADYFCLEVQSRLSLWRVPVFRSELLSTSVDLEKTSKLSLWLCTLQLPTVSRDMNCMKIHTHVYIKDGPCPQSTYNLNQQMSTAFYTNCHLLSP